MTTTIPQTESSRYERIPPELRTLPRWTYHRVEQGKNKAQKVPYQANGQHAECNNPNTWVDFASVRDVPPTFHGISYALTAADGFVCADLDNVRNLGNGEVMPWAREIIRQLDSYTEISPSGTGYHVFVRGKIPKASHRQGSAVELYADKKIIAMTGVLDPRIGGSAIHERDVSWLFERAEAGEFIPAKATPVQPKTSSNASDEDWKLVAQLQRELRTTDPAVIEEELRKRYPAAYAERNRQKKDRTGKTYWRYTIERLLLNKPLIQRAELPVIDEPEITPEDEALPEFPRLPGALGRLVEGITSDLPYDHKALSALTYLGIGLARRVKLVSDPWLQPRFYSCLVGPANSGKSAADVEVRRALIDSELRVLKDVYVELSIDSGPALVQALEEHRRLILAPDELADQFEKARAGTTGRNSLHGEFLRLFESNETSNHTKRARGEGGRTEIHDALFAIVGCATTERFERMWQGSGAAASGLQSRFVLSYSEDIPPRLKTPNDEAAIDAAISELAKAVCPADESHLESVPAVRCLRLSLAAQSAIQDWRIFEDDSAALMKRVLDMAKRFALVVAACNQAEEIDETTMRLGLEFADYQIALRDKLLPADAATYVQAFENRILSFFERHRNATEHVLQNKVRPERYPGGYAAFNQAWAALARAGKFKPVAKNRKGSTVYELES